MRLRVLVWVPLIGALLATLVSALVIRSRPQCVQNAIAICKLDARRGGGCIPRPCDVPHGVPVELLVGSIFGLVLGLLLAVAFEAGRNWAVRRTD